MSAPPTAPRLDELGHDLLATGLLRRWLACGRPLAGVAAFALLAVRVIRLARVVHLLVLVTAALLRLTIALSLILLTHSDCLPGR